MSRTRYKIYNYVQPYFLTMTVAEWIPLFINPEVITLIEASLRFLQKKSKGGIVCVCDHGEPYPR